MHVDIAVYHASSFLQLAAPSSLHISATTARYRRMARGASLSPFAVHSSSPRHAACQSPFEGLLSVIASYAQSAVLLRSADLLCSFSLRRYRGASLAVAACMPATVRLPSRLLSRLGSCLSSLSHQHSSSDHDLPSVVSSSQQSLTVTSRACVAMCVSLPLSLRCRRLERP